MKRSEVIQEEYDERQVRLERIVKDLDAVYDDLAVADVFEEFGELQDRLEEVRDEVKLSKDGETLGEYKEKRGE